MDERPRFIEIDTARGIAILMMVLFHTLFDVSFFSIAPVDVSTGFWRYFAYATATLFLLIVGVSLVVSHDRAAAKLSGSALTKKFLLRGAGIFSLGLLVTAATWLYLGEGFIIFGILHLIGVSVMLSPLFFRFGRYNLIIGSCCILAGFFLTGIYGPWWLLPFGIHPAGFTSVDYTPLFPWFGVVLVGIGIGDFLYTGGVRQFAVPRLPDLFSAPLAFLGRHSLLIYLVHQPVIIILLGMATGTNIL
ncbi:MAG: heparan-alpha-glucosaminide N-acetyltransferase [Methanoregula sp.]|jgi:uncharacterized membrane protein|uniref:heparan-alpha-glucosaminide N-acetyltransferase n=1 Tax=Methanoregula sp. TaxID=2052170 RepID=UPI003D1528C9